jgi:uncharacterized membrane protein
MRNDHRKLAMTQAESKKVQSHNQIKALLSINFLLGKAGVDITNIARK